MTPAPHATYTFGPFELDLRQRQLRREGVVQPLRSRPFDLLSTLVARPGQLVTKDEILDLAWPGVVVEENNIQVQVSVLRKVLGPDAITTVPGHGYRFELPVRSVESASSPSGERRRPPPYIDVQQPPMFGREHDRMEIQALLSRKRQVTITGPGGIGKTCLARAIASALLEDLHHCVTWIDLAAVRESDLLTSHIARAVGVPSGAAEGPVDIDELAAVFGREAELLVLDNAEHVAQSLALLVRGLVERCSELRVLVTSQAPLKYSAETVWRLEPLAFPTPNVTLECAMTHAAVALLVSRVRALDRHFVLREQDVASAALLCRRLDGIPLAIQLAAARVPLLGLRQLTDQLDHRFSLLRSGAPDAPTRQQTLQAVLDWSHSLLSPVEQIVFRRLAVFSGDFDLNQAAEIGGDRMLDQWSVFEALGTLVDRSLVTVVGSDVPRYRLLETTRAYALDKLERAGERETLDRGVALHVSAGREASLAGRNTEALVHLSAAMDLLHRAPESVARDERELSIALELGPIMQAVVGPAHPRCEAVYRRALDCANRTGPSVPAYKAIWGYWHFLAMRGRNREAAPLADQIVDMAHHLDDSDLELEAHHAVMSTHDLLGNVPRTLESAMRVIEAYDRDRHHALTFAFGGHDPGVCAFGQAALACWLAGEHARARDFAARAIALGDAMSDGYSRATGYYYASLVYALGGMDAEFLNAAQVLSYIAAEHDMQTLVVEARLLEARARYNRGRDERALDDMRRAMDDIVSGDDLAFVLVYVSLLVDALLDSGSYAEAHEYIERAIRYSEAGQQLLLPEIYRLRGELALRQQRMSEAHADFARAVHLATQQGASELAHRVERAMARARCDSATES